MRKCSMSCASQRTGSPVSSERGACPGARRQTEVNVTAEAPAGLSADIIGLPAWTLDESQLGDLELLLSGALPPLHGFMTAAEADSVTASGRLPDGTPWPVPVTLEVLASALKPDAGRLLLQDPEGTPLAVLDIRDRTFTAPDRVRLGGPVTGYRPPEHGPFRHLRRSPAEVRDELAGGPVLAYVTSAPLHGHQIGQLRHAAGQLKARLLLLPIVAGPAEGAGRSGPCGRSSRPRRGRRICWPRSRWSPPARQAAGAMAGPGRIRSSRCSPPATGLTTRPPRSGG